MTILVHPTAIVADGAVLRDGVEVGPYCVISGNVTIGEATKLAAFVRVRDYVEIGRNCTVAENAVLGGEPQDHDFKGEETWVRIGDGVIIRESVTIHRSTGAGTFTSVGDGCFLMEGVHVAHNVTIGRNVTVANKAGFAGHSSVGDGAVIGGMAGVHQFTRVGKLCMIGGLSKIVKDIPPFLMVDGHPAEILSRPPSDRLKDFPCALAHERIGALSTGGTKAIEAAFPQLGAVQSIDETDGLRIAFVSGDIVHLRPSGNAPELRCYVEADSQSRAVALLDRCLADLEGWR